MATWKGRMKKWLWPGLFCAALLPAFFDWRQWILIEQPQDVTPRLVAAELSSGELTVIHNEVAEAWSDLEQVFVEFYPTYVQQLSGPADESEIVQLEAEIGCRLPPHYRRSVAIHDGFSRTRPRPWQPQPLKSAFRSTKYGYSKNHGNMSLRRKAWHPRQFQISDHHTINLETGEIGADKNMAEHLHGIARYLRQYASDHGLQSSSR